MAYLIAHTEPIECTMPAPPQTAMERIDALEAEVASLRLLVHDLTARVSNLAPHFDFRR